MDSKNALEAVAAIRDKVPTEERADFDAQLAETYGHAVETAGPVAVANQVQTPETDFEATLKQFLDPEAEMSAEDQLVFMGEFYGKLGFKVPELDEEQKAKLTETIEKNPGKRVMPSPLLHVNWRHRLAEKAKEAFPSNQFRDDQDPLWTPNDTETLYGKLLRQPDRTVKEGRTTYGLGYKAPGGEVILGQEAFQTALVESGHGVQAEDRTVWVFPVMDVQVQSERTYASAGDLHQKVDPTEVPEALITTQMLHQANGTPNTAWHVDFANEAVYELDKKGDPKAVARVAGVRWDPGDRRVRSRAWSAGNRNAYFGVRGAESGLKA
ncbi:MAG TPA: hypothetical protein VMU97_01785 [Candidatus Dormibacteraeota bacterium]|nr:hypothetical protein [Candidatus Dormibacteraeota bacterium]